MVNSGGEVELSPLISIAKSGVSEEFWTQEENFHLIHIRGTCDYEDAQLSAVAEEAKRDLESREKRTVLAVKFTLSNFNHNWSLFDEV